VPSQLKMGLCLPQQCDKVAVKRIENIIHRNI
jgi:hypothetical protein